MGMDVAEPVEEAVARQRLRLLTAVMTSIQVLQNGLGRGVV